MKAIVDASVVLAALMGERGSEEVLRKLGMLILKGGVMAPNLLFYEVVNGLRNNMISRGKISVDEARDALSKFEEMDIELVEMESEGRVILDASHRLEISAYDASYVVLANKAGFELMSLDEKLVKKARGK